MDIEYFNPAQSLAKIVQKAIDNLSESGGGTIYLLAINFYLAQSGTVSNKTAYSNVYNHIH